MAYAPFRKSPLEKQVAENIANLWFDKNLEQQVAEDFKATDVYRGRKYNFGNLMHYLPYLWLTRVLERIQQSNQDIITINPIEEGECTKNFSFNYRNGPLIVRVNGQDYLGIDKLVLMDRIPVIVNIRVGKLKSRGRQVPRGKKNPTRKEGYGKKREYFDDGTVTHPSSMGVGYAMNTARTLQIAKPIKEYAAERYSDSRCGYILFVSNSKNLDNLAIVRKSRRMELIIQPLPNNRTGLRADIKRICNAQGIDIRE